MLYPHVIAIVLSFLPRSDLPSALRVSRVWHEAMQHVHDWDAGTVLESNLPIDWTWRTRITRLAVATSPPECLKTFANLTQLTVRYVTHVPRLDALPLLPRLEVLRLEGYGSTNPLNAMSFEFALRCCELHTLVLAHERIEWQPSPWQVVEMRCMSRMHKLCVETGGKRGTLVITPSMLSPLPMQLNVFVRGVNDELVSFSSAVHGDLHWDLWCCRLDAAFVAACAQHAPRLRSLRAVVTLRNQAHLANLLRLATHLRELTLISFQTSFLTVMHHAPVCVTALNLDHFRAPQTAVTMLTRFRALERLKIVHAFEDDEQAAAYVRGDSTTWPSLRHITVNDDE